MTELVPELQDQLRPYQAVAIDDYRAALEAGYRRIVLVAPTGSGKTFIGARIVAEAVRQGQKVLWLGHRRELLSLASRTLDDCGCANGVLLPGYTQEVHKPVQVASVATFHVRALRRRSIDLPAADIVVVDECHHVRAKSYREILDCYPNAIILGLTATPCRHDGRGLGDVFETLIACPSVSELTHAGFLVPARVYAPSTPNLVGLPVVRGDYSLPHLAERMNTKVLVGDVVEHWLRLADRRPTVVFAAGVAHSLSIEEEFVRAGVRTAHIDTATPKARRDAIAADLESGEVEVVTNALIYTEGWDQPSVSCLVLARPTRSFGLFRQIVGRVLRPSPGKTDALILDHAGGTYAHGFVDDTVVWSLEDNRYVVNPTQVQRGPVTTCPDCRAIRLPGRPCLECGWSPDVATLELIDAQLIELHNHGGVRRPTVCYIRDCGRPVNAWGLCHTHYDRQRQGLPLDAPVRERALQKYPPGQECSEPGCDRRASARGLCDMHHARFSSGRPLDAPVRQRSVTKYQAGQECSVVGCGWPVSAWGLCRTHYNRQLKGLPLDAPVTRRYPPGQTCSEPGCGQPVKCRGLCLSHYRTHYITPRRRSRREAARQQREVPMSKAKSPKQHATPGQQTFGF